MNLNFDQIISSGFNPFGTDFRSTLNQLGRVVGRWAESEDALKQLLAREDRDYIFESQLFGELTIVSVPTAIATNRWKYRLVTVAWDNTDKKWTAGASVVTQEAYNLQENGNTATTIGSGQALTTTPATNITVGPVAAGTPVLAVEHPTVANAYYFSAANPLQILCQ